MQKKKRKIRTIWIYLELFVLNVSALVFVYQFLLPDRFYVSAGEAVRMKGIYSLLTISSPEDTARAATDGGTMRSEVRLLGLLPVKTVDVQIVDEQNVLVSGVPFGVKLYAEGVIVIGMTDVDTAEGNRNPAGDAGLKTGDVILRINGTSVQTNNQTASFFEMSGGSALQLTVRRGEKEWETTLQPAYSQSARCYKAGIWIRDSTAGMGIMTFVLPESGVCAGLGHGVSETDTGLLIPVAGGEICQAKLIGVIRGVRGSPGQLSGCFEPGGINGTVLQNNETGAYGVLTRVPADGVLCEVAKKQEIRSGKAQILTTAESGAPCYYDVEIEKVNYNGNQNFIVHVTDERLLELTGGIVQGMSGSPILRDGKLIGAVTHVFVNDPTRGYGIFAETMLNNAQRLTSGQQAA